ncbi:MAG: transaldolase [Candidatus Acidiferrum sp.]
MSLLLSGHKRTLQKERGAVDALLELRKQGQSIWLDYIRRDLIVSGSLKRLIDVDGVTGITSNPAIFERAIDESTDYDQAIQALLAAHPKFHGTEVYDRLAIEDVRMSADLLTPIYERTGGADGYVSLEPPPQSTRNSQETIQEARRLWRAINRPNLMIKVVATKEGVKAVEALIAEGINVNITLMFSLRHYEAVAGAYIRGVTRCPTPSNVASVASFFVSRVDAEVDRGLEQNDSQEALALRGKIAIANAKMVYKRFREIFCGDAFAPLRQKHVRVQRPLWASTGTKNPEYSDVMYVEELIGSDTVNTIPPATLDAFRNHGKVRGSTVLEGVSSAEEMLHRLSSQGIDLDAVGEKLQEDGAAAFASAYDRVVTAIEEKHRFGVPAASGRHS